MGWDLGTTELTLERSYQWEGLMLSTLHLWVWKA